MPHPHAAVAEFHQAFVFQAPQFPVVAVALRSRAVVVVVLLPVVVAVVVDFLRIVLRSHQAPHTPSRLVEVDPVRPRPVRAPTERIVYLVLSRQSVVVVAA